MDLSAGGLQRENVVSVEDRGGGKDQIVSGVLRGQRVGGGRQGDLHHPHGPAQLLGGGGYPVQSVGEGQFPGKFLIGPGGLALKAELVGRLAAEVEGYRPVLPPGGLPAVGEVDNLVIDAVVGQKGLASGGVGLDYAAVQQLAVGVQRGVIGLVTAGGSTGGRGGGDRQAKGQREDKGQSPGAFQMGFHREQAPFFRTG